MKAPTGQSEFRATGFLTAGLLGFCGGAGGFVLLMVVASFLLGEHNLSEVTAAVIYRAAESALTIGVLGFSFAVVRYSKALPMDAFTVVRVCSLAAVCGFAFGLSMAFALLPGLKWLLDLAEYPAGGMFGWMSQPASQGVAFTVAMPVVLLALEYFARQRGFSTLPWN